MGPNLGPGQLLNHVAPASAALHGELHILLASEASQPDPQVLAIARNDPPTLDLARLQAEVVVRQLSPVQVQSAYDAHGEPPRAPETIRSGEPLPDRRRNADCYGCAAGFPHMASFRTLCVAPALDVRAVFDQLTHRGAAVALGWPTRWSRKPLHEPGTVD